jgi:hypothetical protein
MAEHLLSYSEINETVTCLEQTVTKKSFLRWKQAERNGRNCTMATSTVTDTVWLDTLYESSDSALE